MKHYTSSSINVPAAQGRQQVARADHPLSPAFSQSLFGQQVRPLSQRFAHPATKTLVANSDRLVDQLLVQPGGSDHARLPPNGQARAQFHRHATQVLRVVSPALLG